MHQMEQDALIKPDT